MIKIYQLYNSFLTKQKKLNKLIIIIILISNGYNLLNTLTSSEAYIDMDVIGLPWLYFLGWKLANKLFYKLIGKYWILKLNRWQTKEFQKHVMDKNIKAAGKRGGFKDTSQSGFATDFCKCSIEKIEDKMESLEIHLYKFDLKKLKKFIKENIKIFDVPSKAQKKENFIKVLPGNDLFLKKRYIKEKEKILNHYESTEYIKLDSTSYVINDSVNAQHIITMLYDYAYYIWRLEIDIWVICNQPYFQHYDYKTKKFKTAKIYSPDFKATKNRTIKITEDRKLQEYISIENMLSEDFILFWESEADIWWNNIESGVKQNIQERGLRWGEVVIRHSMGENVMTIRNGQVAGRTAKIQRDLEESFYSVTRCTKVDGGSKRIFIIKLLMLLFRPIVKRAPRLKSKIENKIHILKNSGWLKLETVFSRTEQINYQAPGLSLTQLLDRENPLYMSQYQVTLVFNIRDCWGKYNTHYMEYLGEEVTKKSQATLLGLQEWTPDLKLKKEHILEMNYDTVDIFGIPQKEIYSNPRKYKKVEKQNKNAMRL